MTLPTTRSEFKERCLENLGKGVLRINITDTQAENRIDEAFAKYIDYHFDATMREYIVHEITEADITNKYISLTENIQFVNKVLPFSSSSGSNMFSYEYQMTRDAVIGMMNSGGGNMHQYVMNKQYLSMIDKLVNGVMSFNFNRHTDRLYLNLDWSKKFTAGQYLMFETYSTLDTDTFPDVWGDMWLIKYCTALMRLQWGNNLSKFKGVVLPGGIDMNGGELVQQAKEEIRELEEELIDVHSDFVPFFFG